MLPKCGMRCLPVWLTMVCLRPIHGNYHFGRPCQIPAGRIPPGMGVFLHEVYNTYTLMAPVVIDTWMKSCLLAGVWCLRTWTVLSAPDLFRLFIILLTGLSCGPFTWRCDGCCTGNVMRLSFTVILNMYLMEAVSCCRLGLSHLSGPIKISGMWFSRPWFNLMEGSVYKRFLHIVYWVRTWVWLSATM